MPCPVCRRLRCVDPLHKRAPFAAAPLSPTRDRRPGYDSERRRRRAFVQAALNAQGERLGDGLWRARCPACGEVKALALREWQADHIIPVCAGGYEDGPLRLSCSLCQRRQGGREANRRRAFVRS